MLPAHVRTPALRCLTVLALLLAGAGGGAGSPRPASGEGAPSAGSVAEEGRAPGPVRRGLGPLPVRFEANRGQTDPRVRFLARGAGYALFLTSTDAVMVLDRTPAAPRLRDTRTRASRPITLRLELGGATPGAQPEGLEQQPGRVSYLRGGDPREWRTDVTTFARVRYRRVYPGIDLHYYGRDRQLEYDFVVAPGADPGAIRLRAHGPTGSASMQAVTCSCGWTARRSGWGGPSCTRTSLRAGAGSPAAT